jgi:hypothetical protein
MSFTSVVSVVSSTFSTLLPVPGFLAKLTSLQSLLGFAGWTSALVALVIGYRYVVIQQWFIHFSLCRLPLIFTGKVCSFNSFI